MNIYEQVKQALQDIVAPGLKAIEIEIKRLDDKIETRFTSSDVKVDSLRREITSEIKRLDDKIDSLDDKIDIAIQIRERLAVLEAKLASLEHS